MSDDDSVPSLTVFDPTAPLSLRPEMLTEGPRYLEQRIPGYIHLSAEVQRSRLRVAYLDPEFILAGIEAILNWEGDLKGILGSSGEELRANHEEIARWDETIHKLRAVLAGIEGANLERRYALNQTILVFYGILKTTVNKPNRIHLRPYLETMKRAYMRRRKKPARPSAETAE
jgi:hypothetical protein